MTAYARPRLQDLPDVPDLGDDQVLVFDLDTGEFVAMDLPSGGASQVDLDALEAVVATKQDASTAATDAELTTHVADKTFVHGIDNVDDMLAKVPTTNQKAALVGTAGSPSSSVPYATKTTTDALTASIATKQDSSTAATDAELTAGLATKADASHAHAQSDVTGLAASLAAKEDLGEIHGHTVETPDAADDGKAIVYDDGVGWILATPGGGYTDEQAQDAVGTILADSATVDFTYTDATPAITGIVKAASIDETHLTSGASIPQSKVAGLVAGLAAKMDDGEAAGGVLAGTYPNPVFAVDMATQAELNAVAAGQLDPFVSQAKWGID